MKFEWKDLLDVAHALARKQVKSCTDEACLRTAINRAYYSVCALCRDFACDKEGFVFPGIEGKHTEIINYYRGHPDPEHQNVGGHLDRLFTRRVMADYHMKYTDDLASDSALAIPIAQRILNAMEEIEVIPA